MLPRVKIYFENGTLGSVSPSSDGVLGFVATATEVEGSFGLNSPYIIRSLDDLSDLGITPDESASGLKLSNTLFYKHIKEFYSEAGEGTELWIMGVPETATQSDIVDPDKEYAKRLIKASNGRLKGLFVAANSGVKNLKLSMQNAQNLAEWSANSLYAPLFVLLEGNPDSQEDLSTYDFNRVGVLIGDTVKDSKNACVGLLAGRIARIPVQRHIGRVKDGAVKSVETFIGSKTTENADFETLHDKGFITFRTFVGKSGYFFSDDSLATKVSDDYRSLARRRTVDKAYRIAYQTLIEELNTEIPVTDEGKMVPAMAKSLQTTVESAIVNQMTSEGNLGTDPTDPDDTGVQCYIDVNQNILSTNQIKIQLRIKPFGYAKYINVYLGFKTLTA